MQKNAFVFLACLLLAACVPASPAESTAAPEVAQTPAPYTLTDALGRQVTFTQPPSHIVLAGKALVMVADALYLFPGAADRIAAMGPTNQGWGNFTELIDPGYAAKATLPKDVGTEQIAAAQPDVVILKSYLAPELGMSLETLGIPVVYVDFETPEQYWRDLQVLGTLLQQEARASEIIDFYQQRLAEIEAALNGLEDALKPRVLLLYYSDKDGTIAFNVPPLAWMQTRIVQMAGGIPAWRDASLGKGWTTVNLEQVAAWDADAIIIVSYSRDPSTVVEELKADPTWQLLRAVQQEHLYAFPGDLVSWDQPDTRWILGLIWLTTRLHPERTVEASMFPVVQRFYQEMYGLDAEFIESKILSTLKGDLH